MSSFNVTYKGAPLAMRADLVFPLYRYTEKRWADEFFDTGKIRLNTLLGYKKYELFNEAIGDAHEGQTVFYRYVPQPGSLPIKVSRFITVRNQWTICASGARNDLRMLPAFKADACFSIDSPKFYLAIHEAIGGRTRSGFVDRIVYIPEKSYGVNEATLSPDQGVFAGSFKRDTYSYQNEVRACWETEISHEHNLWLEGLEGSASLRQVANKDPRLQAWLTAEQNRMAPLDLVVPEALRFCTRLL